VAPSLKECKNTFGMAAVGFRLGRRGARERIVMPE
jgi:hypothetical protein